MDPRWMGGVIYILNAIKVLNYLEDERKPHIVVFYRKELNRFVDELTYPYLEKVEWEFPGIASGYISSVYSGKNQFAEPMLQYDAALDAIFPVKDFPVRSRNNSVKLVSWYADLQHKHYPQFFSWFRRLARDFRARLGIRNASRLVLSSYDVKSDFEKFYGLRKDLPVSIFHFASVIDDFRFTELDTLLEKFGLPSRYFMVSNQFHKHKNHIAVLKAIALLKKENKRVTVAFTGKLPENQESDHIKAIKNFIEEEKLQKQMLFLGVLPRQEQLSLMHYAQAVIQPSLFEGWSTVIEDAISLQTPVIASDINVNKEQLSGWGVYFDPHKPDELAQILGSYTPRTDFNQMIYEPYDHRIKRAAESFVSIFES